MRHVGRLLSVCCLVLSTAVTAIPAQRIHTVVDGQTLGAIARRYGITVDELRAANQLPSGSRLKIGQRLLVPSPGEVARTKRASNSAKAPSGDAERPVAEPAVSSNAPERAITESTEGDNSPAEPPPAPIASTEPVEDNTAPEVPPAPAPVRPSTSDSSRDPSHTSVPKVEKGEKVERGTDAPQSAPRKAKAAGGEHRTHAVADGQTLGKIAKRYHLKIESICGANGIRRNEKLKLGQELVIPNGDDDPIIELGPPPSDDDDGPARRNNTNPNSMKELEVPGAGPVYYYEPTGAGRMSMRPIVV